MESTNFFHDVFFKPKTKVAFETTAPPGKEQWAAQAPSTVEFGPREAGGKCCVVQ